MKTECMAQFWADPVGVGKTLERDAAVALAREIANRRQLPAEIHRTVRPRRFVCPWTAVARTQFWFRVSTRGLEHEPRTSWDWATFEVVRPQPEKLVRFRGQLVSGEDLVILWKSSRRAFNAMNEAAGPTGGLLAVTDEVRHVLDVMAGEAFAAYWSLVGLGPLGDPSIREALPLPDNKERKR